MKKGKFVILGIIIVLLIAILALIFTQFFILKKQTVANNNVNQNALNVGNENTEANNINVIENNELNNNEIQNEQNTNNEVQGNNTVNQVVPPIISDPSGNEVNPGQIQLASDKYYYNQLNSNAKILYDKLKKDKDKLVTGNYSFDFDTQFNTLLHTANGEKELNEAFQSAWNAFSYDEPDLFYIDISKMVLLKHNTNVGGIITHRVSIGPEENGSYLKEEFKTKEKIEEAQKYIDNIVNQVVEQTKNDAITVKIKRIHNFLVDRIEYDTAGTSQNKFNIYGAIHDKKAVCEGYARSFKYIMEKVGLPCVLVSGTATNSEGVSQSHAWNYVQINYTWYAVDVTWDDPVIVGGGTLSKEAKYKYLLKGSNDFFKDHKENGVISQNSMNFKFPSLSMTDYVGM